MLRDELLAKIDEAGGEWRSGGIVFKRQDGSEDPIACSEDGKFSARLWDTGSVYIANGGLDYLSDYAEHRQFIVRLADVLGFDLGITESVTIVRADERVVEKTVQVQVIPEEAKARVREADKLEGKVEAYEKLLIGRKIQIDA